MAGVEALRDALLKRTQEFVTSQRTSPTLSIDAWDLLARNAARALDLVDGPTELRPILEQLATADGPRDGESPLTGVALTLGVIADILDSHQDVVRAASLMDRSQLRASILASLHAAAEASFVHAAPSRQHLAAALLLRDLADGTEAGSHVPPRPLESPLSSLSVKPEPGSLHEAVSWWAGVAMESLSSPTRATKYCFQRTAANIAGVCWTASREISLEAPDDIAASAVRDLFSRAFRSWQRAADWPPELRLDGRSPELRHAAQDLDAAISVRMGASRSTRSIGEMNAALLLAADVASVHEVALRRRVTTGGVWIIAEALGPGYLTRHPGVHRSDWLPDPGSPLATKLLETVREANLNLRRAVMMTQPLRRDGAASRAGQPGVWEHITCADLPREGVVTSPVRARAVER